jgi:hypothetical protein
MTRAASRWRTPIWRLAVAVGVTLVAATTAGATIAASPGDPSDVVVLFDFSSSILDHKAARDSFADALDKIADRVDETAADLAAGDATISFVQFASRAHDYVGCTDLSLHHSPSNVAYLSSCLRDVATDYRKGNDPGLSRAIGRGTNYVAAMETADLDLPPRSARPAVVMFTDGKHHAEGVPGSLVTATHQQLFRSRTPFAFLPVGMGLDTEDRGQFEAELERLRVIAGMDPCEGRLNFEWPQVVFDSPTAAGRAVALALQNVTCSFTVEPIQAPVVPGAVRGVELSAGDRSIAVSWLPPSSVGSSAVEDYQIRCQTSGGEWVASAEGTSTDTTTIVGPLENGSPYTCEVAAINGVGAGSWTRSPATGTPMGVPAAPGKPGVEARDGAGLVSVPSTIEATNYRVECSADTGTTWPASAEGSDLTSGFMVGGLTNGTEYACRAFAANAIGESGPSVLSETFRPCGSLLECHPQVLPGLLALLALLVALAIFAAWRWWTNRTRAHVFASVDDHETEYLGRGPLVGLTLVKAPNGGPVTAVVADPSPDATIRVRYRGGDRFEVTAASVLTKVSAGRSVDVVDTDDDVHHVVLSASHKFDPTFDQQVAPGDSSNDWGATSYVQSPVAGLPASDAAWD